MRVRPRRHIYSIHPHHHHFYYSKAITREGCSKGQQILPDILWKKCANYPPTSPTIPLFPPTILQPSTPLILIGPFLGGLAQWSASWVGALERAPMGLNASVVSPSAADWNTWEFSRG